MCKAHHDRVACMSVPGSEAERQAAGADGDLAARSLGEERPRVTATGVELERQPGRLRPRGRFS
jgi:hypothetical protein